MPEITTCHHFITINALNCTIHGREIQLFCYITNSQIVENEVFEFADGNLSLGVLKIGITAPTSPYFPSQALYHNRHS